MAETTQPQPKKRRTGLLIFGVIAAFLLVMFGGCMALLAGGGDDATVAEGNGGSGGEPQAANVGDTVTSGDLELTVTSVRTETEVSDDSGFVTEEARGKYVIVDLEVTNNGDDSLNFFAGGVPLIDPDGNKHDSTADVAIVLGESDLAEPINPGSTATGFIAYDVPENVDVKQSHIEVSGGFLDEPVRVNLQ